MSDQHPPKQDASASTETGVKKDSKFAWLLYIAIAVAGLFFVMNQISSTKKESNSKSPKSELGSGSNSSSKQQVVKVSTFRSKTYDITTTETKVDDVPSGVKVRLVNATVKYCVRNAVEKHCSIGTEDVSSLFTQGASEDDKTLYLWSQGEPGKVTVELEYY